MLTLVGVVLPVALAARYGTLGAPTLDDWAYDLAVFHLAQTGHLYLYHWVTINFVGQAVLALPVVLLFGPHIAALSVWTCCVGLGGLLSLCHLARSLGLPRPVALAVPAFVAVTPVWLQYSVSFMTDVPALSLMAASLALLAADGRPERYVTTRAAAALGVGLVAFTVRETTCAVLVAVVVVVAFRRGRPTFREVRNWLTLSGVVALATAAEYAWRHTLHGEGYQPPPAFHPVLLATFVANSWFWPFAGLLLLPAIVFADGVGAVRRLAVAGPRRLAAGWLVMPGLPLFGRLFLVDRQWVHGLTPTLGVLLANLVLPFGNQGFDLSPMGAGSTAQRWTLVTVSGLLTVLTVTAWLLAVALAVEATTRLAGRRRSPRLVRAGPGRRAVGLTGLLAIGVFLTLYSVLFPLFERDEMVALVPLGLWLLSVSRPPSGRTLRLALGAAAVVASVSVVASVQVIARSGASWRYATSFARAHPWIPPKDITSGFAWNDYQARTAVGLPARVCYDLVEAPVGQAQPVGVYRRRFGLPFAPVVYGMMPAAAHLPPYCSLQRPAGAAGRRG